MRLIIDGVAIGSTCDTSKYALFTNVLKYKNWINNPSDKYEIRSCDNIIDSYTPSSITERPQLKRKIQIDDSSCGDMNISAGLIHGGEFSKRNQFPWMAIIKAKNNDVWSHWGSGSLISSKHVIAASLPVSYFDSSNKLIPVGIERVKIINKLLGSIKYDDLSQSGSLEIGVTKIVNHPKSREVIPSLHINKVSVVTLDREIVFNEFIRPVCLWSFRDDLNDNIGRDTYAVGYGRDHTGKDSLNRKHVRMTVTGIDQSCKNYYSNHLLFQNKAKFFCIKSNDNETPCYYDNQLYMKVESKWYLKGLMMSYFSFDERTCVITSPILCEDIAQFIPWIQNQIY